MPIIIEAADEFLVNFEATANQTNPSITALTDGRFIVTWETSDSSQDGDSLAIKARIFNADGTPVVAEFLVNTEFTAEQRDPQVTALADGRFVITWETTDATQDGNSLAVKARLFDADGTPSANEFLVNSEAFSTQSDPTITALSDGRFVVTWETFDGAQDTSSAAIKARLFNADGTPVADEFLVNSEFTSGQYNPTVTTLADGRFVVTWRTSNVAQDGSGDAIKARLFNADGTPVAVEFLVNSEFTADQNTPKITALADGRFVVTWQTQDGTQDGDGYAIKARLFNADGTPVADEFLVNSEFTAGQYDPQIASLADGRFVVTWQTQDITQDGDSYAIKARLFGADGTPLGDEVLVNSEFTGAQFTPQISTLADGRIVITWETWDGSQDGNGYAVKARILEFVNDDSGTGAADFMLGENFRDVLNGNGGDDIIIGRKGDDDLFGDNGKDTVRGGQGDDKLRGGDGNDTLRGGRGEDDLQGNGGKDKLYGGSGNDNLSGNAGDDKLYGKDGDDVLNGGGGADKLTGGDGDDILTGGGGDDIFIFKKDESTDEIEDFQNGSDKIDLKAFNFASKADALASFYEVGTANDDEIAFYNGNTLVVINGIDMGQLNNADIII